MAGTGEDAFTLVCRDLVGCSSAQSAGVSIIDEQELHDTIRWACIEGTWAKRADSVWPMEACFCSPALTSGRLLVLSDPSADFPAAQADPPINEVMLFPLTLDGVVRGVLWGATHDKSVGLDRDDLARLKDLGNLAILARRSTQIPQPLNPDHRASEPEIERLQHSLAAESDLKRALTEILGLACNVARSTSGFLVLGSDLGESSHAFVSEGAAPSSALMAYIASPQGGDSCMAAMSSGLRVEIEDLLALDPASLPEGQRLAIAEGVRSFQATPIISRDGTHLGVLSTQHDFARRMADGEGATLDLLAQLAADFIDRHRTQETASQQHERLEAAVKVGRIGLWDWNVRTGQVHWSEEHFRMQGYAVDETVPSFDAWVARIHPEDRDAAVAAVTEAMEERREFAHEFRSLHPDGTIRWLSGRGRFFYDQRKNPLRMIGAMIDTTDKQDAMARQQVLVAELQHRVRNILSIVRYVFARTVEMTANFEDAALHFRGRLDALARTQVVVTQSPTGLADLETIVRDELFSVGENDGDRITISGPRVELDAVTAENLGLALHELTMNALKYGALLTEAATLSVTWNIENSQEGRGRLELNWLERGLPLVAMTGRRNGFGRELIEQALPYTLGAETSLEFRPGAVHCRIVVDLDRPLTEQEGR